MIRLTRLSFALKEGVQKQQESILEIYQEEVEKAERTGMTKPSKPQLTSDPEDYDETEIDYAIRVHEISDLTISIDGFTTIEKINGDLIAVKESFDEVYQLINEEERLYVKKG